MNAVRMRIPYDCDCMHDQNFNLCIIYNAKRNKKFRERVLKNPLSEFNIYCSPLISAGGVWGGGAGNKQ
jgi:hypothetical protein